MTEVEVLQTFGKEGITFLAFILVYYLFVRPKDEQIKELVATNRQMVKDNSEQLAKISITMEIIADEMGSLSDSQDKLKNGQDELWREIVRLKKGENENEDNYRSHS